MLLENTNLPLANQTERTVTAKEKRMIEDIPPEIYSYFSFCPHIQNHFYRMIRQQFFERGTFC